MVFLLSFLLSLSVYGADFPDCDTIFTPIDEMAAAEAVDEAAFKKSLFKTTNDKRLEVLRFVRTEKEAFRKAKDEELNAFDLESKKNTTATSAEKAARRKEREALSKKILTEKREFAKNLDLKEKACNAFLNSKRISFLETVRAKRRAPKQTKRNETVIPELEEFKEIPKGPGTVLKPQ